MVIATFFHTLQDGTKAKFTICDRLIDEELFYFAKVINTELDFYRELDSSGKELHTGIEITNGNQQAINYRDPDRLINDIIEFYGQKWLETEK